MECELDLRQKIKILITVTQEYNTRKNGNILFCFSSCMYRYYGWRVNWIHSDSKEGVATIEGSLGKCLWQFHLKYRGQVWSLGMEKYSGLGIHSEFEKESKGFLS